MSQTSAPISMPPPRAGPAELEARLRVKWFVLIVGAIMLIFIVDAYTFQILPQWRGRFGNSGDPYDSPLWVNIVLGPLVVALFAAMVWGAGRD